MEEAKIREVLQQTYFQPLLAAASRASQREAADPPRSAFAYRPFPKEACYGGDGSPGSVWRFPVNGPWIVEAPPSEREWKVRKSPHGLIYLGRHGQAPKLKWYLRKEIDDIIRSRGEKMEWRNWLFNGET